MNSVTSQPKPRVLFINRSYWPDVEATGQLLTELAEDLSSKFETVIISGQPNSVPNAAEFVKSGRELRNGVQIQRVRHTRFSKSSGLGRIVNLVTFFIAATFHSFFIRKVDVAVVETDPFLLPLALPLLRLRHRCKTIVYLQDIYPDVAVNLGVIKNGMTAKLIRSCLFRTYRSADRVVVLSEDMKRLCLRYKVSESRLSVLSNWMDTRSVVSIKSENPFRDLHDLGDKFVVMHSGNMGMGQKLAPFLQVADHLRNDKRILFLFVGDGARKAELESTAVEMKLPNVRFLPYQPREQLSLSLSAADLHIVSVEPAIIECLMPSKIYGVLASGSPVLVMAPKESELYRMIEDENVGICFEAEEIDIDAIASSIQSLSDDPPRVTRMGAVARRLCEQIFDRRLQTDQFAELIRGVLDTAITPGKDAVTASSPPLDMKADVLDAKPSPQQPELSKH